MVWSTVGVVKVNKSAPNLEEQERAHPELAPGGHFQPGDCMARHKVAIIIPYRDRVSHLSVLLHHLHPILQRQQVDYTIFVVEQAGEQIYIYIYIIYNEEYKRTWGVCQTSCKTFPSEFGPL